MKRFDSTVSAAHLAAKLIAARCFQSLVVYMREEHHSVRTPDAEAIDRLQQTSHLAMDVRRIHEVPAQPNTPRPEEQTPNPPARLKKLVLHGKRHAGSVSTLGIGIN